MHQQINPENCTIVKENESTGENSVKRTLERNQNDEENECGAKMMKINVDEKKIEPESEKVNEQPKLNVVKISDNITGENQLLSY